jgi:ferredoxin-NADP reductase
MNPTRTVVVREARMLSPVIREFELGAEDGTALPRFSAGSHVVVHLDTGSRVHHNPYSLLGSPDEPVWRIAVRRHEASRGGSAFLHDRVQAGDRLRVGAPLNLFPLARLGRRHLLFAGGIGITPILAHAREMARLRLDFEIHYGARSGEHAVYLEALEQLAPGRVHLYLDALGQRPDYADLLADQPLGTHLYVCGPTPMIDAALAAGRSLGWPASHLHSEQFLAPAAGEVFTVEAARSKIQFTVAADISLLDAMENAGLDPACLCRGGACGQCESTVLACSGELDHRDLFLSEELKASGSRIMPCVSRVRGGHLVLDL